MTAMLLPVGFALGIWAPAGEPEFCVRVGGEVLTLSPVEYDLWWQSRFHPSAGSLLDRARADELPMPGRAVETLLIAGLLAEVDGAAPEPFAAAHRFVAGGTGRGYDDASTDGLLSICDAAAAPIVRVDPSTYLCWALSDGVRNLAEVIEQAAALTGTAPAELWQALPALVELGTGYVDRMVT